MLIKLDYYHKFLENKLRNSKNFLNIKINNMDYIIIQYFNILLRILFIILYI